MIAVFSLGFSSGLFSVSVQMLAWAKMSIQFSAKSSVKMALKKTFDGKHQCSVCKRLHALNREQSKQSEQPVRSSEIKESRVELAQGMASVFDDGDRFGKSARFISPQNWNVPGRHEIPVTPPLDF